MQLAIALVLFSRSIVKRADGQCGSDISAIATKHSRKARTHARTHHGLGTPCKPVCNSAYRNLRFCVNFHILATEYLSHVLIYMLKLPDNYIPSSNLIHFFAVIMMKL